MSKGKGGGSEYPDAILSVVNIPANNQYQHSTKEKTSKKLLLSIEKNSSLLVPKPSTKDLLCWLWLTQSSMATDSLDALTRLLQ